MIEKLLHMSRSLDVDPKAGKKLQKVYATQALRNLVLFYISQIIAALVSNT